METSGATANDRSRQVSGVQSDISVFVEDKEDE